MKKINKATTLLLALLTTISVGTTAACDVFGGGNSLSESASTGSVESSVNASSESSDDSSDDSSSVADSSDTTSSDSSSGDENGDVNDADYTEWVQTKAPTCTAAGKKQRTLLSDPTKIDEEVIPARGHSYAWWKDDYNLQKNPNTKATALGECTTCGEAAVLPALAENQAFTPASINSENTGYNPISLTEGCYNVEIPKNGEFWLCFSSETPGQYAFHSVGGTTTTVERYSAEVGYTCNFAADGKEVEGNFYSYVNRSEAENGDNWRALFCIKGEEGDLVNVRFVRIGAPIWVPNVITSMVYPTEIKRKKAPEPEEGDELNAVPYDSDYFFDETAGYYRMGTKDAPGAIIYAAINKSSRQFTDDSFISAFKGYGNIFNLIDGTNADGDKISLCYIPFIYNCKDDTNPNNGEINAKKNCYLNYCNSDGVYPVTRELYQFLNLYTRQNKPGTLDDSYADEYNAELNRNWREHKNEDGKDANKNKFWLASCYYYGKIELGTEENPHALAEGNNEIVIPKYERYYATLSDGTYRVVCNNASLKTVLGNKEFDGALDVVVRGFAQLRFDLGKDGGETTVTVTKITTGADGFTAETPKTATLGETTFTPTAIYAADGTAEYSAYYKYTPTANGTLTLTITEDSAVSITIGGTIIDNDDDTTVTETATVSVKANESLLIYVSAKNNTDAEISSTLSFTEGEVTAD